MALHAPQIIKATSTQDLNPLPLASNNYPSVLPHEMYALEPGDIPSRILSWKALGFLGSFTHSARRLSCPWGRDPWGTRNCFVSCPYSFPQHCMPYRLSVGAGLFTNLFWIGNKNTWEREYRNLKTCPISWNCEFSFCTQIILWFGERMTTTYSITFHPPSCGGFPMVGGG